MNTENNKLIAEFMGFDFSRFKNDGIIDGYNLNGTLFYGTFIIEELKFNSDWNWLMEVVDKIESIKIETYKVRVDIYFNCCQIYPTHWGELISIYGNKETKIEAVYKACVEFIKWHNENNYK